MKNIGALQSHNLLITYSLQIDLVPDASDFLRLAKYLANSQKLITNAIFGTIAQTSESA